MRPDESMDGCTRIRDDIDESVRSQDPVEDAPSVARHPETIDEDSLTTRPPHQPSTVSPPLQLEVLLVIAAIAKRPNVITLLKTAVAFGVTKVLVVGQEKNLIPSSLPTVLRQLLGMTSNDNADDDDVVEQSHQTPYLNLVRFRKWRNVVEYLRERNIPLVGVEIHPSAITISDLLANHLQGSDGEDEGQTGGRQCRTFALVMGNEGYGLSQTQMDACRHFVRIPQYGSGTASLNVAVAASIVLHQCHTYQMSLLDEEATHESDHEASKR
jgi:tRNA G18 (ribose-2'-O)-methylase SpoU